VKDFGKINSEIQQESLNSGNSWFTNSCTFPTQTTWTASDKNITNNPLFVNTNAGNYRLSQISPCINAGLNQSWMDSALDLDGGHYRLDPYSRRVDMGCYVATGKACEWRKRK
jgi:hypothetical protein